MFLKKITLLLLAFSCAVALSAQAQPQLSFNHIALSVKDLDRSASFYKDVMKLTEITNNSGRTGIRWFSLSGGRELHLILNPESVLINKSLHIAFASSSFDGFLKHMNDLKIPYSDFEGKLQAVNTRGDGIKQIYFQDPDGYWLEVNSVGARSTSE